VTYLKPTIKQEEKIENPEIGNWKQESHWRGDAACETPDRSTAGLDDGVADTHVL
jgi:hypothetical protein